jgi:hypothetical protein
VTKLALTLLRLHSFELTPFLSISIFDRFDAQSFRRLGLLRAEMAGLGGDLPLTFFGEPTVITQ